MNMVVMVSDGERRSLRTPPNWWPAVVAAAAAVVWFAVAPAAAREPTKDSAVIDLCNNGFLLGNLLPAPAEEGRLQTSLRWQAPLFKEPLEFPLDGMLRVRFRKVGPKPLPDNAWQADLRGGDFVAGVIDSIDADHVVMRADDFNAEPLRIRRESIERLLRTGAAVRTIVPGALSGWTSGKDGWQEQAGRLVSEKPGAAAYRDVAAPGRCFFTLVLSWDERPNLDLLFAAGADEMAEIDAGPGGKKAAPIESYRIELTAGDLLAIREGGTAQLDRVASVPAGPGTLEVQVFVDQDRGRMAVVRPSSKEQAKPDFDETIPPRKQEPRTGFGIRLRSGRVRIESLRVSSWTDPEPTAVAADALGGPDAVVESFDKAAGTFSVRSAEGLRPVAAAEVSEIVFPSSDAALPASLPGAVRASVHGGSRLTGQLLEVTPTSIRLACPATAEPVECKLARLAEIDSPSPQVPAKLPSRAGILETTAGQMLGSLVNAAERGAGIAWLPRGALAPAQLAAPSEPIKISYTKIVALKPRDSRPPLPADSERELATIFLKTGDSIRATVLSADPEGLRIKTDLATEVLVPSIAMRAVELTSAASVGIPREKLTRLLTLPRMQQADPPTHMIRLASGDYLRGKLVSLDERLVRMNVLGVVKELPRSAIARVIWLSVEDDSAEAEALAVVTGRLAQGGLPVRVTMSNGRRLTLAAERMDGDLLIGTNGVFGSLGVDLQQCNEVELFPTATDLKPEELPYGTWRLIPATLPRVLQGR